MCGGCGKEWTRTATCTDEWQECPDCKARNYPYSQYEVKEEIDELCDELALAVDLSIRSSR